MKIFPVCDRTQQNRDLVSVLVSDSAELILEFLHRFVDTVPE